MKPRLRDALDLNIQDIIFIISSILFLFLIPLTFFSFLYCFPFRYYIMILFWLSIISLVISGLCIET